MIPEKKPRLKWGIVLMHGNKPRLFCWDLETTHFKANMGHILTAAGKYVGEDHVYTWRIDDVPGYGKTPESYMHDQPIVEELIEHINNADAIIHHYGDRFDMPFLRTRALDWDMFPPAPVAKIDTWRVMRDNLAMTSNGLAAGCAFLNDSNFKGHVDISQWKKAFHGDKNTISTILEYNIGDVLSLEELYLNLLPVMNNHPVVARLNKLENGEHCPVCASTNIQYKGIRRTKCFNIQRVHCQDCGSWRDGKRSKVA